MKKTPQQENWTDPVVEEIHAIRKQIAEECRYDVRALGARLQQMERAGRRTVVNLQAERPTAAKK